HRTPWNGSGLHVAKLICTNITLKRQASCHTQANKIKPDSSLFQFLPTTIDGCYKIQPKVLTDYRGTFAKLFHSDTFQLSGLKFSIQEVLLSSSAKNVLRGMHFQSWPKSTAKLVACLSGEIFDGVVDLRKQSPTYLKTYTTRLSEHDPTMIFIPEGLAHGFYSFQENSTVLYLTSGVFSPE